MYAAGNPVLRAAEGRAEAEERKPNRPSKPEPLEIKDD